MTRSSNFHYILTLIIYVHFCAEIWAQEELTQSKQLLHTIVFVTKRPGGYDILLHSLSKQSNKNYELICVDELAPHRKGKVQEMAEALGVNLVAVTTSKPKTHSHTRFGIANAFNTGFVLSSGDIVTVLQDYIYLPADFVEKTLSFHAEHDYSLLSYPEYRFSAPDGFVDLNLIHDPTTITVFHDEVPSPEKIMPANHSNHQTTVSNLSNHQQEAQIHSHVI
jgi:glycosyltransferase involved in cell wall biosynthesis